MVGESKKTVFESWLAAYGDHLVQVARGTTNDVGAEIGDPAQERNVEESTSNAQDH